jgi:hypothetical protein
MSMKTLSMTAAVLAAAFVFGTPSAQAALVTPAQIVGETAGIVEEVHGGHRSCSRTARGGWHYHRGRARISCAPRRSRVIVRTPSKRVVVVKPRGDRVIVKPRGDRVIVRP